MKLGNLAAVLIFVLGLLAVLNMFYRLRPDQANKEAKNIDILGENTGNEMQALQGEVIKQVSELPEKILPPQTVTEITEKVNKIITQKLEETSQLPEKGAQAVREEIRKEMYRQICQEWLK